MLELRDGCTSHTAECFLAGNALAGAIPTELGQLVQLEIFYLYQNQLTGTSKKLA